jgi:two-component system OmpR family response regulator
VDTERHKALPDSAPRVAVVDDERHIRELLEIGLSDEGYTVRSAADGRAGLELVREWQPDVVVLDVMMPKIDGIALLPMLRQLTEAPIVMLSAKGEVEDKIAGLTRGADDYVSKPFEMAELVARLESALRRPKLARPHVVRYADLSIDLETRVVTRAGKSIELSAREFEVLVALARNPRRVFTRDQLLDIVWGERDVGQGNVETYISYLRAKIDQGFSSKLIHTHRGAGYSLRAD